MGCFFLSIFWEALAKPMGEFRSIANLLFLSFIQIINVHCAGKPPSSIFPFKISFYSVFPLSAEQR